MWPKQAVCSIVLEMPRILLCGLAVVLVCYLTSEAHPINNARVGVSEFDTSKEEGSYKHQHPRPPSRKQDTILSQTDESNREKRYYNYKPPVGNHDKVTLSDESNREKRDYNYRPPPGTPPPPGNHEKVILSDESNREKRDYNYRPPTGNHEKVILSDKSDWEKRDYNYRPPTGNHEKVILSDESNREKRDYNYRPPSGIMKR